MPQSESPRNQIFKLRKAISSLSILPTNSLYSSAKSPGSCSPARSKTFSESIMEENIANAEAIITKWDLKSFPCADDVSLFHHDRKEAEEFLKSVKELRRAMHFLIIENSTSRELILAQKLMQVAMNRLQKEFYGILSANRDQLSQESVSRRSSPGSIYDEDKVRPADELEITEEPATRPERVSAIAMSDLKSIAGCMIHSGYGKECAKIYKIVRKSNIDEALYHLGIEQFRSSESQKMDRGVLEYVARSWMNAMKTAVTVLFSRERILCDHVFSASEAMRDSCFCEITKDGATSLFRFPELILKSLKAPEKVFLLMELFESISDLWPDIESIFSSESTSAVRLQAHCSMLKLEASIHALLADFELTIQKDSSRIPVSGGGIDPMTESAMAYISLLADYNGILSIILADYQPPRSSQLPESYFESQKSDDFSTPAVALQLAWLILVLLCKLDRKAELYKDVSLSYLFLANNIHFIVETVSTSNLKYLLGDGWIDRHTKKVKLYASSYESTAWTKIFSSFPEKTSEAFTPQMVKECFKRFNAAFQEAYEKQTSWMVPDGQLRDYLKLSIAKKLAPRYQELYDTYLGMLNFDNDLELFVRFPPDDLENYLSDLFHGTSCSGSSSSTSPSLLNAIGCLPALPR